MRRLLNLSEKLADSIRLRDQRGVENALRSGANPDVHVSLKGKESFGPDIAPVIYLAIYHDMPEVVKILVEMGAKVHLAHGSGLTPRAHAAWLFRWECVDAFDSSHRPLLDDESILTVIATHWSNPSCGVGLEDVFFHRLDRVARDFSVSPETAFGVAVGVLCGWEDFRISPLKRLLAEMHFNLAARQIKPAFEHAPNRFVPHYVKMHEMTSKFLGGRNLPDDVLEILLDLEIPLAPAGKMVNERASAWLEAQQARANSIACRADLAHTVEAAGEGRKGRL